MRCTALVKSPTNIFDPYGTLLSLLYYYFKSLQSCIYLKSSKEAAAFFLRQTDKLPISNLILASVDINSCPRPAAFLAL